MKKFLIKLATFFAIVILVVILKKFTILSTLLFGKGLFFVLWIAFVFIFQTPYQVSVLLGLSFLMLFPAFYFLNKIPQGERIVVYAWGFLITALIEKVYLFSPPDFSRGKKRSRLLLRKSYLSMNEKASLIIKKNKHD